MHTGKVLDALGSVDSSAFGSIDLIVNLEQFGRSESEEILLRNLRMARIEPETEKPLRPFEPEVVERLLADTRGVPRVINLIAFQLLDSTATVWRDRARGAIALDLYKDCMTQIGTELYAAGNDSARDLIRRVYGEGGYLAADNLLQYIKKGFYPDRQSALLEDLTQKDFLVKIESAVDVRYELSPQLVHFIGWDRAWKEEMSSAWAALKGEMPSSGAKGRALEDFAARLFSRVFKVVERNLRTETEELDIVLEYAGGDPIWARSPTILVECKNWSSPVPQHEVSTLCTKARLNTAELCFVVSPSGFTADAQTQARDIQMRDELIIVLLSGEDIEAFLAGDEVADDFLKRKRRSSQLRK